MNNLNILIPVYNDWKSVNKLLQKIDQNLKNIKSKIKIVIINDKSNIKPYFELKKLKKIKQIIILNSNTNLGSQKSIALGLDYLKKKHRDFCLIIMDGDGEDSPKDIPLMIEESLKSKDYVITSNRIGRKENLFLKLCYKIHLLITFVFTLNWVSFGNFSCMHSKNVKNILSNNNLWYAYSSGVLANSKIKRIYAKRQKRYFDKSKTNFLALIEHSFRIMAVFYERVFFSSLIYIFFSIILFIDNGFKIAFFIFFLNLCVLWNKIKHYKKGNINYKEFLVNLKKINLY
ncbi:MAG: hypothetical protein CMG00_06620 [Candidatus Marinimicrobia bacterium]|nr:hypothetical protein [Candidatus Neomarinimicrobiota bacterium]|tara:strand:+ start:276 stop:1139 length:864 start_codon:yes stop_codon:yes gene_type:complete